MSTQDDITPTQIIQVIQQLLQSGYCVTAVAALVVYEYFITLRREVELFWTGKWTGAAVLFYFNRYLSLLVNVYGLVGSDAHTSPQSCVAEMKAYKIVEVLQYLPWAVFSTLRALALSRNYPLAIFVFCLSIVPIPVNLSNFPQGVTGVIIPLVGCVGGAVISWKLSLILTITCRTSLMAADLLLIYITWANLYRQGTPLWCIFQMNGFIAVLLRDGTIYFTVLLFLNVLRLIESAATVNSTADVTIGLALRFWEPITTILISRFLLHLQAADRRASNPRGTATTSLQDSDGSLSVGSIVFERVVGSLGASIDIRTEDELDNGYMGTFDDDDDEGRAESDGRILPTQVKELEATEGIRKDDSSSRVHVHLEGRGVWAGLDPMTPPSSPFDAIIHWQGERRSPVAGTVLQQWPASRSP